MPWEREVLNIQISRCSKNVVAILLYERLARAMLMVLPWLQVLTYGLQNNNPEWVRYQYTLGIQGAIVDDVAGIISAFGRASSLKAPALEDE